jgi:hypothetical protein
MVDWRIYERDVDIVLAEEFYANAEFAAWILSKIKSFANHVNSRVIEVQVSLSDQSGESDLVIVFENSDKSKIAVLIEDKIDAVFQHEQLARYRMRGQNGIAKNQWNAFEVILCAPRAYLEKSPVAAQFDGTVAYEDIAVWLRDYLPDRRGEFRADFLESAAPYGASAYIKNVDSETNAFWKAAFDLAHSQFSELEMKNLEFASGNTWLEFRPGDFPVDVRVFMKGSSGLADLTFNRMELGSLDTVVSTLPKLGTTHKTGKSSCIRPTFPPFEVADGLSAIDTKVRTAFGRCRELIHFYRGHRDAFESIVSRK